MSQTFDLVVVGGGIIGCAVVQHAAQLLPRSARILLLDRGAIAGATSGSCMGHLMVTPDTAQDYAFTKRSLELWAQLAEQQQGFGYNPTGALYLADEPEDVALFAVLAGQFAAQGDRSEILTPDRLRDLEPGLAADLPGGLFYPGDGVVLPMLACGAMLNEALRSNPQVVVRPFCAVQGFELVGERVVAVRTERETLRCNDVVLAAGVWTPELGVQLGLPRLPIYPRAGNLAITGHHETPVRTQLLEVSYLRFAHGAAQVDPTRTDDAGGHAMNLQPQVNGGCLIGSTRQFRGMDKTLNRALLRRSLQRATRYVPKLAQCSILRTWVGLRPYSLDKHPLIGPWPNLRGLWLAAGHEGLGISLAPITGRLLAEQLTGIAPSVALTPYLPARFSA